MVPCIKCGRMGHLVRHCPDQQGFPREISEGDGCQEQSRPRRRDHSGRKIVYGEWSARRGCQLSGYINGIKSDRLIDTGSMVSLVPRRMVGDDLMPTGADHVKLRTVDGIL